MKKSIFAFVTQVVFIFVLSTIAYAQQKSDASVELDDKLSEAIKQIELFPEVSRDVDLTKQPAILAQIIGEKTRDFLVINEGAVEKHFAGFGGAAGEYLSIPFYIEVSQGRPRFIISSGITDPSIPLSSRLYYTLMLKAYAALPQSVQTSPSAWSHGICSFIAQDYFYPGSTAACPDLDIETAIAALLFHTNENLLWSLYPENKKDFDKEAYLVTLKAAITSIGSEDPDSALKELLRSPEEYTLDYKNSKEKEGENKEATGEGKDEQALIRLLDPSMAIMWKILPSKEERLRSLVDFVNSNVKNTGLRIILLNACYDKLCAVTGQSEPDMITDSSMLLMSIAEGTQKDADKFLKDFEQRREEAWGGFNAELKNRNQTGQKLTEITFDPAMLKWTFTFLYNYSYDLRKGHKEFLEEVKKKNPGINDSDITELVKKELIKDPGILLKRWRSDPLLSGFLDIAGDPQVRLSEDKTTAGLIVECSWNLRRKGSGDTEKVVVQIFDPFSSGGGKPKPGVSDKAKVVVRKDLNSEPQVIELKDIQEGFLLRTVNTLDKPDNMTEDWARVTTVQREGTKVPWQLDSGSTQPLIIGRNQYIRAKTGDQGDWTWMKYTDIRADRDRLLGIKPEGPSAQGQQVVFPAVNLTRSNPLQKGCQLVVVELSYSEIEEIKDSGIEVWGYFADGRFVQAPVKRAPVGVDGKALIELPAGTKKVDELKVPREKKKGDQVNAFDYGQPETFVDEVQDRPSYAVDYFITISYTLPDGTQNSINVAEGQKVIVFENGNVTLKKVYQLKKGNRLVCSFQKGTQPLTAFITDLTGKSQQLGVYKLKLKSLPLVRINGILIPVELPDVSQFAGIEENSIIQFSPSLEKVQQSTVERIDIHEARIDPASNVKSGDQLLAYNVDLDSQRGFHQLTVEQVKKAPADCYLRIVTSRGTLECGHLQGIFVTKGGWDQVKLVPAGEIRVQDKVIWLNMEGKSAGQQGTVELLPVTAVEPLYATKKKPYVVLHRFLVLDPSKDKLGYTPNFFANGILVLAEILPEGEGEEGTSVGKTIGKKTTPEMPGKATPKPGSRGKIQKVAPPKQFIRFDDPGELEKNRVALNQAFKNPGLSPGSVRQDVMVNFLSQYAMQGYKDKVYNNINRDFKHYLQTRDYLLSKRNPGILSEFVKNYAWLAVLTYEAGGKDAGDTLTRDFLSILTRAVRGTEEATGNVYANKELLVREGFMLARDILLYMRDKEKTDGFRPVSEVHFSSISFKTVLDDFFINKKHCSTDILDGKNNVNLYNLCRQLDTLYAVNMEFAESLITPQFKASELFKDEIYHKRLGIENTSESVTEDTANE